MISRIAEIAVNAPLSRSFHYEVPSDLEARLERGHRVLIPFGPRLTTGVCVGFPETSDVPRLKPIRRILHPDCRFDDHLLELTRWIADYYRANWGEVLEAALPPSIRSGRPERTVKRIAAQRPAELLRIEADRIRQRAPARARALEFFAASPGPRPRADVIAGIPTTAEVLRRLLGDGWIREEERQDRPDPFGDGLSCFETRVEHELNEHQVRALEILRRAREARAFRAILLHGITGSGKTEIYLRVLRDVLEAGGRGLVLVPEISLTPQTVMRFRQGLPAASIAVLHSMLSPAERTGQWREIQEGKARLVIGARSAVFAPIPDLRLIIVDEEHESSYKQESSPRYHARDVAVVRGRMLSIPVVLGSATPSLESTHNARNGKYELVELPSRATPHDLPAVVISPLDGSFYRSDGSGLVTDQLDYLIRRQLQDREQMLIYLNRRGFATYLHCVRCGFVMKCDQCDVTLTFHRGENIARCHYCGLGREIPAACPECLMPGPRKSGVGTERVFDALKKRYPEARIARLDRDVITTHRKLRTTLAGFARGDYDMLVGTQMLAKGHDFPRVSLVGILLADTGLSFPDFRAAERTFQLITQMAGRAGRGAKRGRVIVQTFFPDHYAVRCAASADYRGFCNQELERRRPLGYPPFGRLVKIVLASEDEEKLKKEAARIGRRLRESAAEGCQVLGPAPSPIAKIQNRHRKQILLKAKKAAPLQALLRACEKDLASRRSVDVAVDVDPQSMM
ncbi:MAG: primosomal protein N' [Planctomycetes bacterium]|nr:primosomal protein N' [Planctomycetota bacterium]